MNIYLILPPCYEPIIRFSHLSFAYHKCKQLLFLPLTFFEVKMYFSHPASTQMTRITTKMHPTTAFSFISSKTYDTEYLPLGEHRTMKELFYFLSFSVDDEGCVTYIKG